MKIRPIALVLATGYVALMSFLFMNNLPNWCAHPEVGSNADIQFLCPTPK